MIENLKEIGSLGVGGAVVVIVMRQFFNYLAKKKADNNPEYCPYITKEDHKRECDYKLSFINNHLNNLDTKIDALDRKFDEKMDSLLKALIKINGGK